MRDLSLRRHRRRTAIAVCAVALAAACRSVPPKTSETPFQRELSAEIEEMLQRAHARADAVTAPQHTMSWTVPVSGVQTGELVDSFGDAREGGRAHEGIDIFASRGTPVIAATDGSIARIAETPRGGRVLWIFSDTGYALYYAHLDRWQPGIAAGDRVSGGDVIGYVGNTGNASGGSCHLHFEIRDGDSPLDPYTILAARATSVSGVSVPPSTAASRR